ncbi:MAG: hypothetical protein CMH31_01500 [Micavibrio sp.]|nr:hypothetical protein [Micavibrio sp.]
MKLFCYACRIEWKHTLFKKKGNTMLTRPIKIRDASLYNREKMNDLFTEIIQLEGIRVYPQTINNG